VIGLVSSVTQYATRQYQRAVFSKPAHSATLMISALSPFKAHASSKGCLPYTGISSFGLSPFGSPLPLASGFSLLEIRSVTSRALGSPSGWSDVISFSWFSSLERSN
jgi:hypothetical protein